MKAFSNKQKTLAVLLACAFFGCATATPADAIDAFFEVLREGDTATADKMFAPPFPPEEEEQYERVRGVVSAYFKRISYEIQEVIVEEGAALVSMVLHYPDKRAAGDEVNYQKLSGLSELWVGGEGFTDDEVAALLISFYEDDELAFISKEIEVVMVMVEDDGWKILDNIANLDFFRAVRYIPEQVTW